MGSEEGLNSSREVESQGIWIHQGSAGKRLRVDVSRWWCGQTTSFEGPWDRADRRGGPFFFINQTDFFWHCVCVSLLFCFLLILRVYFRVTWAVNVEHLTILWVFYCVSQSKCSFIWRHAHKFTQTHVHTLRHLRTHVHFPILYVYISIQKSTDIYICAYT